MATISQSYLVRRSAVAAALCVSSAALSAAELYSQTGSLLPGQRSADALGGGRAVFDDFTLATDAQVTRVEWTGGVVSAANPSGVATAPDVKFFLSFRSDDGAGAPAANPFAVLTDFSVVPGIALSSSDSQAVFRYELDLLSAVNLSANTTYWLQITALFDGVSTDNTLRWDWSFGGGGNGTSAVYQPGPGANANGYASFPADMSFSIIGTPAGTVAEPQTALLAALGLMFVASGRRGGRRAVR